MKSLRDEVRRKSDEVARSAMKSTKRWVKSLSKNAMPTRAQKGKRNKNKHKSAQRPKDFNPFAQTNASKGKKAIKEKVVGAVSKNAA